MTDKHGPGLGELLRHLQELIDTSGAAPTDTLPFHYRPRFTPLLRALAQGSQSVSMLESVLQVSQGAISQTLKLMAAEGLVVREPSADARVSRFALSPKAEQALPALNRHWQRLFAVIRELEQEIDSPLRTELLAAIRALEAQPFASRLQRVAQREAGEQAGSTQSRGGYFDTGADNYAASRPSYPPELAAVLAQQLSRHQLAVDVGCGSGQLTRLLSPHFERVIGTDASAGQIAKARELGGAEYRQQAAEQLDLPQASVDLITVAQAAHWLDLDKFYARVHQVAAPGALLVFISYGVPSIVDACNSVFQQAYWRDLYHYWPAERRHVENAYRDLPFPFRPITAPALCINRQMSCRQFIAYMQSWSAYKLASEAGERAVFERVFKRLQQVWPGDALRQVQWPLTVKMGRVFS